MGRKEFDEFVTKSDGEPQIAFDKDKELKEWKDFLKSLFSEMEGWIKSYVDKGLIKISTKKYPLYEEFYGEYEVDAIVLTFKEKAVYFEPIGTMLVGAKGRVDVKSEYGTRSLILVDKDSDGPNIKINVFTSERERKEHEEKVKPKKEISWDWKILDNKDRIKYIKLNEDSFFDIIMEVMSA
ncbi:MAG: hypothetical protein FWB78_08465 [Treponema sp.]|nr:hypothetical protein [Treponema sp.]